MRLPPQAASCLAWRLGDLAGAARRPHPEQPALPRAGLPRASRRSTDADAAPRAVRRARLGRLVGRERVRLPPLPLDLARGARVVAGPRDDRARRPAGRGVRGRGRRRARAARRHRPPPRHAARRLHRRRRLPAGAGGLRPAARGPVRRRAEAGARADRARSARRRRTRSAGTASRPGSVSGCCCGLKYPPGPPMQYRDVARPSSPSMPVVLQTALAAVAAWYLAHPAAPRPAPGVRVDRRGDLPRRHARPAPPPGVRARRRRDARHRRRRGAAVPDRHRPAPDRAAVVARHVRGAALRGGDVLVNEAAVSAILLASLPQHDSAFSSTASSRA